MSKTLDLRKTIKGQLALVQGETYYRHADTDSVFPYKTFSLSRINIGDAARDDIELSVDVWDRSTDPKRADEIADQIEELFNVVNLPQNTILPTFFKTIRYQVDDPDTSIQHIHLEFLIQMYTLPSVSTN